MSKYSALAKDLYKWCKKKNLWCDIIIYFDGRAWTSFPMWGDEQGKKIDVDLYEFESRNPKEYFEFANPETLSMSFEGRLYHVLNAYVSGWQKLTTDFEKIFEKHDCYYEMGHSWNLSVYEN